MKIGFYNAHLNTMGGGEKHMGSIVEFFNNGKNTIDLITNKFVDISILSKKLQINLKDCNLVVLKKQAKTLEELSEEYDIFFNSTYLSTLKPRAKKNVLIMFFPNITFMHFLSRSQSFKKFIRYINTFDLIQFGTGFYHFEKIGKYFGRHFGRWSKDHFSFSVTLGKSGLVKVCVNVLEIGKFSLDNIDGVIVNGKDVIFAKQKNKLFFSFVSISGKNEVTVKLKKTFKPDGQNREVGIFVKNIQIDDGFSARIKNLILSMLRGFRYYDFLSYYDLILVNSEYTQRWLYKIWRESSIVLHPLVEVEEFLNEEKKENIIISVGRFFVGNHNKKHVPMINSFKRLHDNGLLKDWRYVVCGGTHPEKNHQEYLEIVKNESKGYPINVYPDISFEELKRKYANAMVFWHAAGYGENEKRDPDKFEHFGITTVEAMASGCIPVVIGRAGQVEIVKNGDNGFLWEDMDDLEYKMRLIVGMSNRELLQMRQAAINRANNFSRVKFMRRSQEVFHGLLNSF